MNFRVIDCQPCNGTGEDQKLPFAADAKKPVCKECKGVGKIPLVEHLLAEVLKELRNLNSNIGKLRGRG